MESDSPRHADPEIAALLDFEPVPRKCLRKDGWTPDNQRRFICGLAEAGDANLAANAVGLTARGAYELRKAAGAEGFIAAWDAALAFHRRRNRRPPPPAASAGLRRDVRAAAEDEEEVGWDDFADRILVPYMLKLHQEREARLAGRIVEADWYVRQLTWLEVALDLGEGGIALLKRLRRGDLHAGDIVATPMSVLLDQARRAYWREQGEPERPPPASLGAPEREDCSTGEPPHFEYRPDRDGEEKEWKRREDGKAAIAAEAQRAWEEKARRDAVEWRARLEGTSEAAAPGTEPGPQR